MDKNFSQAKWDTSDHNFDNMLRDQGGELWHDMHVMVKGPIVWVAIAERMHIRSTLIKDPITPDCTKNPFPNSTMALR